MNWLTVYVSPLEGGSINLNGLPFSSFPVSISQNTSVMLEAIPAVGFEFLEWTGDITGSGNPSRLYMSCNKYVTANFIPTDTHTLTYIAGTGGTISGASPQTVNDGGSGAEVTAVADEGFLFVQWSDGLASETRTDTNVTRDIDVTAEFAASPVPDDEIVPADLDLDGDGIPDRDQDNIHVTASYPGGPYFGLLLPNGDVLEDLEWMDAAVITDMANRPDSFPLGLVRFRMRTVYPGATVNLTIYCSEPIPEGASWWKHDPVNGWMNYSAQVVISEDRMAATLQLRDGGIGDADGVVNGVIEDPSGPAFFTEEDPIDDPDIPGDDDTDIEDPDTNASGGSDGGGCFLKTVLS